MIPGSANPLLLASAAAEPTEYQISRSLRFNSSDSAYLSRTPSVAGDRRQWTWAAWIKRSVLGGTQTLFGGGTATPSNNLSSIEFDSDRLRFYSYTSGSLVVDTYSLPVYRDAGAWMHLLVRVDTATATPANRIIFYVNGSAVARDSNNPSQSADLQINTATTHYLGAYVSGRYFSGYLADIHFIDGQALDPTSFGEFDANGVWQPKAYTGTYPGNSFHLPFSDNSTAAALGTDTSGAGNNWTVNNISVAAGAGNDSLVDTPTNYGTDTGAGGEVRGNYATLNPLTGYGTLANGNLEVSSTIYRVGTIAVTSGKWYYELTAGSIVANSYAGVYIDPSSPFTGYVNWGTGGYFSSAGGSQNFSSGSIAQGDIIGVAFDRDNGTFSIYRNGTYLGQYSGLSLGSSPWYLGMHTNASAANPWTMNFGQRPFAYPAPSGFKALCTTNLPEPLVAKPSEVMDVKLYTGNGSTQTISGLGFSPDLVWIKMRSKAYWHELVDTVRGANKSLFSNATDAEATINTVTAFNSNGFTVGTNGGLNNGTNEAAGSYVAWTWDAGSSTVTNTQGSITSQVRANPSAGFSVTTWTGTGSGSATVGHGLGVAPAFFIVKDRSLARNWLVYHEALGSTTGVALNSTNAESANIGWWNNTAPTSTVATIGLYGNESSNYVGYFWSPLAGYSSFGSYTGNGSADGPFVYTGFRPRWLLVKRTDSNASWILFDAARNTYNIVQNYLLPDSSSAEGTGVSTFDFLSNGFKMRSTQLDSNGSGGTYIYAAFAESPFQFSRAR